MTKYFLFFAFGFVISASAATDCSWLEGTWLCVAPGTAHPQFVVAEMVNGDPSNWKLATQYVKILTKNQEYLWESHRVTENWYSIPLD